MGRSSSSAARFTGDAAGSIPRPLGRSGCVTTSFTPNPAATSFSSVGTAKSGVPQNTRSIIAGLPFALLHKLADLAFHHVAFQGADVTDIESAIEVIGFMHKRTGQQFFSANLDGIALQVLRPSGNLERTRHILAELRNAEAAFARRLPP